MERSEQRFGTAPHSGRRSAERQHAGAEREGKGLPPLLQDSSACFMVFQFIAGVILIQTRRLIVCIIKNINGIYLI